MLNNEGIGDLIEVSGVSYRCLYHCPLVPVQSGQVEKHVCSMPLAEDKLRIQFFEEFPTSFAARDILLHAFSCLSRQGT